MFLGAGSVMHGMNDEVDMRRYGALRKVMMVTFVTFVARLPGDHRHPAVLRLLLQGQDHRGGVRPRRDRWIGLVALLGAGVTAFYMTRLVVMTFFGKQRWPRTHHPHESPMVMTGPDGRARRCCRSVAGFLLAWNGAIENWLSPGHRYRRGRTSRSSPALLSVHHAGRGR